MFIETLIKVEPSKHMYRWYSIGIQSTLVDGLAVIYGWGSLKSPFQQWRTIPAGSQEEAEKIVIEIIRVRLKKGYVNKSEVISSGTQGIDYHLLSTCHQGHSNHQHFKDLGGRIRKSLNQISIFDLSKHS
jgi:predicted DNA-binding WGR domain protein